MPHPRLLRVRTSLSVALLLVCSDTAMAQLTYQQRDVTTPPPTPLITINSPSVCTVDGQAADAELTDESFIKLYTGSTVNVTANITGACDWYNGGQFYLTQTRNLSKVIFSAYQPANSTPATSNFFPNTYTQSMDTQVAGTTSGPQYWSASGVEGRHTLDFQTMALSTNCSIPNYSTIVTKHINAMACKPEWLLDKTNYWGGRW